MDVLLTVLAWCALACLVIVFAAVARWTWGEWLIVRELRQERQQPVHVAPSPIRTQYSDWWQAKRDRYSILIYDFPAALLQRAALIEQVESTPTAEYRVIVEQEFGVRLDEVGPRESRIPTCDRLLWDGEGWVQEALPLRGVVRYGEVVTR